MSLNTSPNLLRASFSLSLVECSVIFSSFFKDAEAFLRMALFLVCRAIRPRQSPPTSFFPPRPSPAACSLHVSAPLATTPHTPSPGSNQSRQDRPMSSKLPPSPLFPANFRRLQKSPPGHTSTRRLSPATIHNARACPLQFARRLRPTPKGILLASAKRPSSDGPLKSVPPRELFAAR